MSDPLRSTIKSVVLRCFEKSSPVCVRVFITVLSIYHPLWMAYSAILQMALITVPQPRMVTTCTVDGRMHAKTSWIDWSLRNVNSNADV